MSKALDITLALIRNGIEIPECFFGNSVENKKMLLDMARADKPRPTSKDQLGMAWWNYTGKTSDCYDAEFDKQIKQLRPDWFKKSN